LKLSCKYKYALITPARNEEAYIEKTVRSVISQTILPTKWIIVSDGSTDHTNSIVSKYLSQCTFIELLCLQHNEFWGFGSKAKAIEAGYAKIRESDFDFIGNLDADITFNNRYYESVLNRFSQNNRLGIAGGMIAELYKDRFEVLKYNTKSVAGAVQLFRRKCYDEIGGYIPLKYGGIDAVAEIMARMHGWEIESFLDIIAYHHRRIGGTNAGLLYSRFHFGIRDYSLGTHPMFMILKSIDRLREKPRLVGGMLMLCGYMWEFIKREKQSVPDNVVKFLRKEQKERMVRRLKNGWRGCFQ